MTPQEFRAWRIELHWTQRQVSEALGFHLQHVRHMEHGTKNITEDTARRFAAYSPGDKPEDR